MDVVLIGGLWLTGAAWEPVLPGLVSRGHRAVPVTLPGQGDGATGAGLEDQVAAVVAAVDAAGARCVVAGHSAASSLAWLAADRRPDAVAAVALIGGFPAADGAAYADFFEPVDGAVAFPGWGPFEGPDADDLDAQLRAELEAGMVPVPEAVTRGVVRLRDERRYDVPVVMVCPEYTPDQARAWVAAGDLPELAAARRVEYVDLASGHWPMASRPDALATLLADVADAADRGGR